MQSTIAYEFSTKTILDLRNLQLNGHLNLEPGFQRKSVWTLADRRRFIKSVLEGYPVPSIFLYRREENGQPIYDVLDGKQRLETVFMFSKVKPFHRQGFDVNHQFLEDDQVFNWEWKDLERMSRTSDFLTYKFQVAEVKGDFSDIVDLFVRINSTGKSLTSSEKRHAKFYTSPFLKESQRLAKKHRKFLMDYGIMRAAAMERMKDVELVSELIASLIAGGPIHKKQAVDKAVGDVRDHAATLKRAVKDFSATLQAVKGMFPELKSTRFSNQAEFYTLFLVVHELLKQKLLLTDKKRNESAMGLLRDFSDGVDAVRERQRQAQGALAAQRPFADYLMLVQSATDNLGPRKRRMDIVRGLLEGLFEAKDERRIFSVEQRRLLWNSDQHKKCDSCGVRLDWTNFQVDHVTPYSKGGKTKLDNAALLCGPCNASKGAGPARRKAAKQGKSLPTGELEEQVQHYVSTHGSITPAQCRALLKFGDTASAKTQTSIFLKRCSGRDGFLRKEGAGRNTAYYPR